MAGERPVITHWPLWSRTRPWPAPMLPASKGPDRRIAIHWLQPHTKRAVWRALQAADPAAAEALRSALADPNVQAMVADMGATVLIDDPRPEAKGHD